MELGKEEELVAGGKQRRVCVVQGTLVLVRVLHDTGWG